MPRSGKTQVLRHIGNSLKGRGKSVAFTGSMNHSAVKIRGLTLCTFLGIIEFSIKVRREQLEGMA